MPATIEVDIEWNEHYAWWPVRSSWSKKRIWFKKYWVGEIFYDAMSFHDFSFIGGLPIAS